MRSTSALGSRASRALIAVCVLAPLAVVVPVLPVGVASAAPATVVSVTRVSLSDAGAQIGALPTGADPGSSAYTVRMSGDGRFVGFTSVLADLVPGDTNGTTDVFVRDTVLGRTVRVSVGNQGEQTTCVIPAAVGTCPSWAPASVLEDISYDGRYVLFNSFATNLGVPVTTFPSIQLFVRDRDTDGNGIFDEEGGASTILVSRSSVPGQTGFVAGNALSYMASMSGDGRFIAYVSAASNLVAGDTNRGGAGTGFDVFRYDRDSDADGIFDEPGATETVRASLTSGGVQMASVGQVVRDAKISNDGRYVGFMANASDLVVGGRATNDIYVRDIVAGTTTRVDYDSSLQPPSLMSHFNTTEGWDMTPDGRYVVFTSNAPTFAQRNLDADTNHSDIYKVDRDSDGDGIFDEPGQVSTTLLTRCNLTAFCGGSTSAKGQAFAPAISDDGAWVAFAKTGGTFSSSSAPVPPGAAALVLGPTNDFLYSNLTRTLDGLAPAGTICGCVDAVRVSMSPNGNFAAFNSDFSNLVTNDTNGLYDVFVANLAIARPATLTVAVTPSSTETGPGATRIPLSSIPADRLRRLRPDVVSSPGGKYSPAPGGKYSPAPGGKYSPSPGGKYSPSALLGDINPFLSGRYSAVLREEPLGTYATALAGVSRVRQIPLLKVPVMSPAFGTSKASWEALLSGTTLQSRSLQELTLGDVLDLLVGSSLPPSHDLRKLGIGAIAQSDTALESASLAGLLLGATPVRLLTYTDGQTWCTKFDNLALGAASCTSLGVTVGSPTTLLELDFNPTASSVLDANPMLRRPPVRGNLALLRTSIAPVLKTRLADVGLRAIRVGNLPLTDAMAASPALASTRLDSIATVRGDLSDLVACDGDFVCTGATKTLEAARTAGSLFPKLRLGDLQYALGGSTATFDTVAGLVPADLDINDVAAGLLQRDDFPWEDLDLEAGGFTDFASAGSTIPYSITVTPNGGVGPFEGRVSVELPYGFRLIDGTTTISSGQVSRPTIEYLADRTRATWTVRGLNSGVQTALNFSVRPGLRLGSFTSAGASAVVAGIQGSSGTVSTTVSDTADAPPVDIGVPAIGEDTLVLGYVPSSGDRDVYSFTPPAATATVSIRLSHLAGDADLVVYGPPKDNGGATSPSPLSSSPVPPEVAPLPDDLPSTAGTAPQIPPELTAETPTLTGQTVLATSTAVGAAVEGAVVVNPRLIQVGSYNGATASMPYVVRVATDYVPLAPSCPPYSRVGGVAGTMPNLASLPTNLDTLILWNRQRTGDRFGTAAANSLDTQLNALASAAGVVGAVLPVDGSASVAAAVNGWNSNPCDPAGANAVVRSVVDLVAGIRNGTLPGTTPRRSLRNVVIVGGDDLMPMARLADITWVGSEVNYAGHFAGAPIGETLAQGMMRSDDPYADLDPIQWQDRRLYVPDLAVGRLVETPADITNVIQTYIANNGVLDTSRAYAAGYDFMLDGASSVRDALSAALTTANGGAAPTVTSRISPTWTKADLLGDLPGNRVSTIFGHFEHSAGTTASGETFTPTELADALPAGAKVVLSMGCHSGLSVADSADVSGTSATTDFAQAVGGSGAVYIATTGFGYGAVNGVGLHERLFTLFAQQLDGAVTIGDGLTYAKQTYFGTSGLYGVYDEKVLETTVLYGLPMWKLSATPRTRASSITATPTTDPATGLQVADFSRTGIAYTPTATAAGSYYTVNVAGADQAPQVLHGRPTEPRFDIDVTAPANAGIAHGVVITRIRNKASNSTYNPTAEFDGIFAGPTLATNGPTETVTGDIAYPSRVATVATATDPTGAVGTDGLRRRQRVVIIPGHFTDDGVADTQGIGHQELYDSIGVRTYYSTSTDFTPPTVSTVAGDRVGDTINVHVAATDNTGTVTRVAVLVNPGIPDAEWTLIDTHLVGEEWIGSGRLASGATDPHFIVQALDNAGNVAVSTAKGRGHIVQAALGRPSAPTDVAVSTSLNNAHVSWSAPANPGASSVLNYEIWGGSSTGQLSHLATVSNTTNTYTDEAVAGPRVYAILGVNTQGPGELSSEVSATVTATSAIAVTKAGGGAGSVQSSPVGITCGATCSAEFVRGSTAVLTATPAPGSLFTGWSGAGCTGTGSCPVPVSANQTVIANFAVAPAVVRPSAPEKPTITQVSGGLNVAWVGPVVGLPITDYQVQTATLAAGPYANAAGGTCSQHPVTTTSCTLSGLNVGARYYVRVVAVNAAGSSTPSRASLKTKVVAAPGPVIGPACTRLATRTAYGAAKITWGAATNNGSRIVQYEYSVKLATSDSWGAWTTNMTRRTLSLTGLAKGAGYSIRVRAVNALGIGPESSCSVVA